MIMELSELLIKLSFWRGVWRCLFGKVEIGEVYDFTCFHDIQARPFSDPDSVIVLEKEGNWIKYVTCTDIEDREIQVVHVYWFLMFYKKHEDIIVDTESYEDFQEIMGHAA